MSFEMPTAPAPEQPKRRTGFSKQNLEKFVQEGAIPVKPRSEDWSKPGDKAPYEAPTTKSLAEQIYEEEEARKGKKAA